MILKGPIWIFLGGPTAFHTALFKKKCVFLIPLLYKNKKSDPKVEISPFVFKVKLAAKILPF